MRLLVLAGALAVASTSVAASARAQSLPEHQRDQADHQSRGREDQRAHAGDDERRQAVRAVPGSGA